MVADQFVQTIEIMHPGFAVVKSLLLEAVQESGAASTTGLVASARAFG